MGLWLSRPRVHDRVAVASLISSTITTPGGPGGPGGERGDGREPSVRAAAGREMMRGDNKQEESLLLLLLQCVCSSCTIDLGDTKECIHANRSDERWQHQFSAFNENKQKSAACAWYAELKLDLGRHRFDSQYSERLRSHRGDQLWTRKKKKKKTDRQLVHSRLWPCHGCTERCADADPGIYTWIFRPWQERSTLERCSAAECDSRQNNRLFFAMWRRHSSTNIGNTNKKQRNGWNC